MAPRRRVDKGKAPMVEEEPVGRRTRSRTTGVVIREAQAETSRDEQVAGLIQTEQKEVVIGPEIAPGEPEVARTKELTDPDGTTASSMQVSAMIPQMAVMVTRMAAMVQDLQDFFQFQSKKRGRDSGPERSKKARTDSSSTTSSGKFCHFCKRHGHVMSECCRLQARHRKRTPRPISVPTREVNHGTSQPRSQRSITCYLCGEPGHIKRFCPRLRKTESGTSSASQPPEENVEYQISRGGGPDPVQQRQTEYHQPVTAEVQATNTQEAQATEEEITGNLYV